MIENRIKDYRNSFGMTQAELAKSVGVRRETIYNLEHSYYNPSLTLAWNIAQVFGVTIEDVFSIHTGSGTESKLSESRGRSYGSQD